MRRVCLKHKGAERFIAPIALEITLSADNRAIRSRNVSFSRKILLTITSRTTSMSFTTKLISATSQEYEQVHCKLFEVCEVSRYFENLYSPRLECGFIKVETEANVVFISVRSNGFSLCGLDHSFISRTKLCTQHPTVRQVAGIAVSMSHSSESEQALWKKLIDLGIFDDFYPLRLNACFRYLDVEKTQSFSLKVHCALHSQTNFVLI